MGVTVVDAGILIAVPDASDVHHAVAKTAPTAARDRGDTLVLPASAYAECLVWPFRRGHDAAAVADAFVDALPARVEPGSRAIGAMAAQLRATHGSALRLPDALVIATAVVANAERVITTDAEWPTVPVHVEILGTSE